MTPCKGESAWFEEQATFLQQTKARPTAANSPKVTKLPKMKKEAPGIEPWSLIREASVKTTSPAGLFKLVRHFISTNPGRILFY